MAAARGAPAAITGCAPIEMPRRAPM